MNATAFLKTVDHAAAMSDRWLFLAAFCLLLILCGTAIRWLAKERKSLAHEHKLLREKHCAALEAIAKNQNEVVLRLIASLDQNKAAHREHASSCVGSRTDARH
jgi:hypothetical protein